MQIKIQVIFDADERRRASAQDIRRAVFAHMLDPEDEVLLFLLRHHIDLFDVREHKTGQRTYTICRWRSNGAAITKTTKEVSHGQTL